MDQQVNNAIASYRLQMGEQVLESEEDRLARHKQEVAKLEEVVFAARIDGNWSPALDASMTTLSEETEDEMREEKEAVQTKSSTGLMGAEAPVLPTNLWQRLRSGSNGNGGVFSRKKKNSSVGEVASEEV